MEIDNLRKLLDQTKNFSNDLSGLLEKLHQQMIEGKLLKEDDLDTLSKLLLQVKDSQQLLSIETAQEKTQLLTFKDFDEFIERVEKEKSLKSTLLEIESVLSQFIRVTSNFEKYSQELSPYQEEAQRLLQSIKGNIQEKFLLKVSPKLEEFRLFLRALEEVKSDVPSDLLDEEIYKYFSKTVCSGINRKLYYIAPTYTQIEKKEEISLDKPTPLEPKNMEVIQLKETVNFNQKCVVVTKSNYKEYGLKTFISDFMLSEKNNIQSYLFLGVFCALINTEIASHELIKNYIHLFKYYDESYQNYIDKLVNRGYLNEVKIDAFDIPLYTLGNRGYEVIQAPSARAKISVQCTNIPSVRPIDWSKVAEEDASFTFESSAGLINYYDFVKKVIQKSLKPYSSYIQEEGYRVLKTFVIPNQPGLTYVFPIRYFDKPIFQGLKSKMNSTILLVISFYDETNYDLKAIASQLPNYHDHIFLLQEKDNGHIFSRYDGTKFIVIEDINQLIEKNETETKEEINLPVKEDPTPIKVDTPSSTEVELATNESDKSPLIEPEEEIEKDVEPVVEEPTSDPVNEISLPIPPEENVFLKLSQSADKEPLFEEFIPLIWKLILDNDIPSAVTLLKSVSLFSNQSTQAKAHNLYQWITHGSRIGIDSLHYSLDHLEIIHSERNLLVNDVSDDSFGILKLAFMLWAYFEPELSKDYGLYQTLDNIQDEIDVLFDENVPSLKQLFIRLSELITVSYKGFTSEVIDKIKTGNIHLSNIQNLKLKAKNLIPEPKEKHYSGPIKLFFTNTFGSKGPFNKWLEIVSNDDISKLNEIEAELEKTFNKQTLEDFNVFIDERWDESNKYYSGPHFPDERLLYEPRSFAMRAVNDRIGIINSWVSYHHNQDDLDENKIKELTTIMEESLVFIEKSLKELSGFSSNKTDDLKATIHILTFSLERMKRLLNGNIKEGVQDFITFVQTPYLVLDKSMHPIIDPQDQEIFKYEPWRRVLHHLAFPKLSYEQVINLIKNQTQPQWFNNIGTYRIIKKYIMNETEELPKEARRFAVRNVEKMVEDFLSELDLAMSYGKIVREEIKEKLYLLVKEKEKLYGSLDEYGHFWSFIQIMYSRIKLETEKTKEEFKNQLNHLIGSQQLSIDSQPIYEIIDKNIEEENFGVAEIYMNQLQEGNYNLEREDSGNVNHLNQWLKAYAEIYTQCSKPINESKPLKDWASKTILKGIPENQFIDLLNNWPRGGNTKIVFHELLAQLGFEATSSKPFESSLKVEFPVVEVFVKRTQRNIRDFKHPIAAFGTEADDYFKVIYTNKETKAYMLMDDIRSMNSIVHFGKNTIILFDRAISIDERRRITEEMMANQKLLTVPFILVDRVLLLYLATLNVHQRLSALLKCTLPFNFIQPYVNSRGVVSDEIFVGRRDELNELISQNGPQLLYGGRQLGKSALLVRAQRLKHDPSLKKFAYYIDILNQKVVDLPSIIIDKLSKDKLLAVNTANKIETVFRKLEAAFANKDIEELSLFFDESDSFLDDASHDKYIVLTHFLDLARVSNNKFRFIFAGLHNVARTQKALRGNTKLSQLAKPLCIQPLKAPDARKLVEIPLSYLGIKVQDKQMGLILEKSNYYPGIIQYICYTIINSLPKKFPSQFNATNNPPYVIDDEFLREIFIKTKINNEIKEKIMYTIDADLTRKYHMISYVIAYLYYDNGLDQYPTNFEGFEAGDIKKVADEYQVPTLNGIALDQYEDYLSELCDMGILISHHGKNVYRFRRRFFLEIFGTLEQILNEFIEEKEPQPV